MKKFILNMLLIILLISVTSCNNNTNQNDTTQNDSETNIVEDSNGNVNKESNNQSNNDVSSEDNNSNNENSQSDNSGNESTENDVTQDNESQDEDEEEDWSPSDEASIRDLRDEYDNSAEQEPDESLDQNMTAWLEEIEREESERAERSREIASIIDSSMNRSAIDNLIKATSENELNAIRDLVSNGQLSEQDNNDTNQGTNNNESNLANSLSNILSNKIPDIQDIQLTEEDLSLPEVQNFAWSQGSVDEGYQVSTQEADIPIVGNIGRGYNIFSKYASASSLKTPVLDINKMVVDGLVERKRLDESSYEEVIASSARALSSKLSKDFSFGVDIAGFDIGLGNGNNSNSSSKDDKYCAKVSYIINKYDIYIKPVDSSSLRKYLTEDAKRDLNSNMIPKKVFEKYGYFVLADAITGGRVDFNITKTKTFTSKYSKFKNNVSGLFSVFGLGGSRNNDNTETLESEGANIVLKTVGGNALDYRSYKSDPKALEKWANSVYQVGDELDKANIVAFGTTRGNRSDALIPIWELCDNNARRNQLKQAFYDKSRELEAINYGNTYIKDIEIIWGKNEQNALAKKPSSIGWEVFSDPEQNLNYYKDGKGAGSYMYLAYKSDSSSKGALTDMFVEIRKRDDPRKEWEAREVSNSKFGKAQFLPVSSIDLNRKRNKGNRIQLWYTKDNNRAPIVDIKVMSGEPLPKDQIGDWEYLSILNGSKPANFNDGLDFTDVYILILREQY